MRARARPHRDTLLRPPPPITTRSPHQLRKISAGETELAGMGDTSTLADPSVLQSLINTRAQHAGKA